MEIWGEHNEYPGYRFSTYGNVEYWSGVRWIPTTPSYVGGKALIRMSIDGKRIVRSLAAIILQIHSGPRPIQHQPLRYPDPDIRNNRIENLRWAPYGASKLGRPFTGKRPDKPKGKRKIDETQAKSILQMAAGDFTDQEIAERMGLSHTHVTKIVTGKFWKELSGRELIGGRRRKRLGENHPHSRFTNKERQRMLQLRKTGETLESIAKRFKTNRSTISKIIKAQT